MRGGFKFSSLFVAAALGWIVLMPSPALSGPLAVNVLDPERTTFPGAVEKFSGTITNATGGDLFASDLFLNFFNIFDPAVLILTQLLGIPDFQIIDGTTTGVVDLFEVSVGSNAQNGATYLADFSLESFTGIVSDVGTIVLFVPEPSTLALLFPLLVGLGWKVSTRARWSSVSRDGDVRAEGERI